MFLSQHLLSMYTYKHILIYDNRIPKLHTYAEIDYGYYIEKLGERKKLLTFYGILTGQNSEKWGCSSVVKTVNCKKIYPVYRTLDILQYLPQSQEKLYSCYLFYILTFNNYQFWEQTISHFYPKYYQKENMWSIGSSFLDNKFGAQVF